MSQIQSIGSNDVRAAIARAAQATGTDFDYLLAQARLESSLDPSARAGTSSAAGLYQFTGSTWMQTLQRHGAEHGLSFTGDHAAMLALRFDPDASAMMAGALANDNKAALTGVLGRAPDAAELYLAHFLGTGGAVQFLGARPDQSAAALMPAAARANKGIFFDQGGAARSVSGVMELLRTRLATAMGHSISSPRSGDGLGGISPTLSGEGVGWGLSLDSSVAWAEKPQPAIPDHEAESRPAHPVAAEFAAINRPARASMAETLHHAFGLTNPSAAPGFVRAAYGQLKAFGL